MGKVLFSGSGALKGEFSLNEAPTLSFKPSAKVIFGFVAVIAKDQNSFVDPGLLLF